MCLEVCTEFFTVETKEYIRFIVFNSKGDIEMRATLPLSEKIDKEAFTLQIQKFNTLLQKEKSK